MKRRHGLWVGLLFVLFLANGASSRRRSNKVILVNCQQLQRLWSEARYRLLPPRVLRRLDWSHLELLRNGIFAHHYRPFPHNQRLRYFFYNKKRFPWYKAWKSWKKGTFNRMEWDNIWRIQQEEKKSNSRRWNVTHRYRVVYRCRGGERQLRHVDPRWDRWRSTPFPVVVHCREMAQQIQALSRRRLRSRERRKLRRKGWLHLALVRNGLYAVRGRTFQTAWMQRFFQREFFRLFPRLRPRRQKKLTAILARNARALLRLERRSGSLRLSSMALNLRVRCLDNRRYRRLTRRQKVVLLALSFLGTPRVYYGKQVRRILRRYRGESRRMRRLRKRYDCSGLVESVFQVLDMDLSRWTPHRRWNRNGVKIIYYNLLHKYRGHCAKRRARLGDLVFFDYCWDANGNGNARDDSLTHIGIVSGIYPDGTVEFVHNAGAGRNRRIEIGRLNLKHPRSRKRNKPYPMCLGRSPARVFRCYGFPYERARGRKKRRRRRKVRRRRRSRRR